MIFIISMQGHVSRVRCFSVHEDHILSGSDDRSAKLWSSKSSSSTALLTLSGHAWPVSQVCLSGTRAVTADSCSVRVWNILGGQILQTITDQSNIGEICIDHCLGMFIMCHGGGGISCHGLRVRNGGGGEMGKKEKDLSWSWGEKSSSEKVQSRIAVGHSTMIHVNYSDKKCDKVGINIHDFLC